jgi:hypothetical protein
MQATTAHSDNAVTNVAQSSAQAPSKALTRWKIALNCGAVALCMLLGALMPMLSVSSVAAEAMEFFRNYGSVLVAAMALTTLVVADMMSWPLLTQSSSK